MIIKEGENKIENCNGINCKKAIEKLNMIADLNQIIVTSILLDSLYI